MTRSRPTPRPSSVSTRSSPPPRPRRRREPPVVHRRRGTPAAGDHLVPGWPASVTFAAVLAALMVTGAASAALGRAPRRPAVVRNVLGGAVAMGVTYGIGSLIGAAGM